MFTFHRNEHIILLVLCTTLLVGLIITYLDKEDPDSIPDFEVIKKSVPVPPIQNAENPTPTEIHIDLNSQRTGATARQSAHRLQDASLPIGTNTVHLKTSMKSQMSAA